jgi:hypothetical protein
MKGTLALVRFEFERHWLAPVVGLTFGLVVLAMPLVPGFWSGPANDFRTLAASTAAIGYAVLLAIALGGSLAAKDLAERRASFLFARPLSGLSIAIGRLVAALALVTLSAGLLLLPTLLAGGEFFVGNARLPPVIAGLGSLEGLGTLPSTQGSDFAPRSALEMLVAIAAFALLLTSAVVLASRARTGWVVLEFVGVVLLAFLALRAFAPIGWFWLPAAQHQLFRGLAVGLLASVLLMFVVAIRVGRTDLRRAHRAQAIVAVMLLAATGGGALLWIHAYIWPSFEAVVKTSTRSQNLGRGLFAIGGVYRDELWSAFVVDAATGRSTRVTQQNMWQSVTADLVETAAGSIFWPALHAGRFELGRGTPSAGGLTVEMTALGFDKFPSQWAISADGTLFAGVSIVGNDASRLEVFEVASGSLVAATRLAAVFWEDCQLAPETDGFRLVVLKPDGAGESFRIDPNGRVASTGKRAASPDPVWPRGYPFLDADRQRLFVREGTPQHLLVLDATTLLGIARLEPRLMAEEGATLSGMLAVFLDGAVAISAQRGDQREIALFSAQGELLRSVTMMGMTGSGARSFVGLGLGHVLLFAASAKHQEQAVAAGTSIERLDLESGARRVVAQDLAPLWAIPRRPGPVLLRDDSGRLSVLDPDSGELTAVPSGS